MNPILDYTLFVYFGNADDDVKVQGEYDEKRFLSLQQTISKNLPIPLFFLKQTHSNHVHLLKNITEKHLNLFHYEGDAIITQEKNIGIGVVTADCLPLILYDKKNNALGVVHAGWRGLAKKIITATVTKMCDNFKTNACDLTVYLGPCAGVCCYEIQNDFLQHFPKNVFEKKIIEQRAEKLFFNQCSAASDELLENKIMLKKINIKNNICTMCTPGFCSARNQKENAGRQPTIAFLF